MKLSVTSALRAGVATVFLWFAGSAAAQPVEAVLGVKVNNPGAFLAAMEMLYQSDAFDDQTATVWAAVADGSSPATHTVVVEYDDFAHYDRSIENRNASRGWARFGTMVTGVTELMSTRMAVQLLVRGSGWRDHGALVATAMSVSDPEAYGEAFAEWIDAVDNPGSIRLMEMRFGGEGTTHVALLSGPNAASLNASLDDMIGSDAYAEFAEKVADIRQIRTVSMLRRVRTYGE